MSLEIEIEIEIFKLINWLKSCLFATWTVVLSRTFFFIREA